MVHVIILDNNKPIYHIYKDKSKINTFNDIHRFASRHTDDNGNIITLKCYYGRWLSEIKKDGDYRTRAWKKHHKNIDITRRQNRDNKYNVITHHQ